MDTAAPGPRSARPSTSRVASAVDVSQDEVHASHDGDHVSDQDALHQLSQRLQVAERGRSHLHPIRLVGAIGNEVEPELATGALDEGIHIANRSLEAFADQAEVMNHRLHTRAELAS